MKTFQNTFETRKRSFISGFTICMTVSLKLFQAKSLLKVQLCKLYNSKYKIASRQITNTEIVLFIAVLVFNLLSRKVFFSINRKDNRNCTNRKDNRN